MTTDTWIAVGLAVLAIVSVIAPIVIAARRRRRYTPPLGPPTSEQWITDHAYGRGGDTREK